MNSNEMSITFPALSKNEAFARSVAAAFANVSALTRKQKFGFLDILLMSVSISLYILMQFELGF